MAAAADAPSGYKVVFVTFQDGKLAGDPVDSSTEFLTEEGMTRGRPVGVTVDPRGALIVADNLANTSWRITRDGQIVVWSRQLFSATVRS